MFYRYEHYMSISHMAIFVYLTTKHEKLTIVSHNNLKELFNQRLEILNVSGHNKSGLIVRYVTNSFYLIYLFIYLHVFYLFIFILFPFIYSFIFLC